MSQSSVSIDVAASVGAAVQQPAPRSADPRGANEFAAHLRRAGGHTSPERSPRTVRSGGSPEGSSNVNDEATTPDGDDSTTDSTGTAAGSTTPTGADAQPAGTPTAADPAASPQVIAPTVTAAVPAVAGATAATAAQLTTASAGAVTGADAKPHTAGVAAAAPTKGATVAATVRGAVDPSAVDPSAVDPSAVTGTAGRTGGHGPARLVAAGTERATPTPVATAAAGTQAAATEPSPARSTGSSLGAVVGTVDPSSVVGAATTPHVAPLNFSPLGAGTIGTTAVSAASSTAAGSAPAPTTTAPQTSVATQLAASLRTLSGRGDGVHVMTVRLHPDELGPVRVVARLTGTEVHLRVTASSVAAAAAVSDAAPRLHEALASSGLTTTGVSVDHDTDLGGQFPQGGQHQGQGAAGSSADGRQAQHAGSSRENHMTPRGFRRGVQLDVNPSSPPSRHPAARSLDLHV